MADRRLQRSIRRRLRPLFPLAGLWLVGLTFIAGVVLQRRVPYEQLLLDPNSVNGAAAYTGLVSNLGILGWTTATVTGFFGAWVAAVGGRPGAAGMLWRGALLSTLLLLDDLFQLHIAVGPFGISKPVVYLAYMAAVLAWLVTQRHEIARTRVELLVAAGGALGLSVMVDQLGLAIPGLGEQTVLVLEDAAKFLGVLAWAEYFVLTSGGIVTSIVRRQPEAGPDEAPIGTEAATTVP